MARAKKLIFITKNMKSNYKILLAIQSLLFTVCFSQPATTWKATGPNLFPIDISGQINGIGRVSQLKFHPSNPNKMYVVSASGGLWISSDTASTWLKTGTDKLLQSACASICIDHTNDNILYLGTGDANYYGTDFGVWKSIDGGINWLQSTTGMGNRLAIEILMDPTNNNVLVAATDLGIYRSINAGANWSLVKTGGDFKDMQLKYGTTNTLFAVTSSEFWRSTDFGITWNQITSGVVVPGGGSGNGMRLALSASNPNIVYIGMIKDEGTILKSIDGGNNFVTVYHNPAQSLVGYDITGGGQGNYNFSMTADPTNANIVFVVAHVVWRSIDGGVTWTQLTDWWAQLHTDMHGIKFHPSYTNKLFNCNDGGVWLSNDLGDNWVPKSDSLSATEIYHASQSPIKRDMISIGTQDNGELFYSSNTWKTNRGGDWGSRSSFDYITNNTVYYNETGNRRPIHGSETSYNLPFAPTNNIVLEFPKKIPNVAFTGEQEVWRTTTLNNTTPSWNQISTFNQKVMAINSSPADSNLLYVITNVGKIHRSDNALSAAPTFTNYNTPIGTSIVANIASIKTNSNVVYISCGNRIYRSANKGATWTNVTLTLPTINILKIYHDEYSSNEAIYVCNANGVYYKDLSMTSWINISYNLPTIAPIQDFMFYNSGNAASLLRVGFYGRGVWELPINTSMPPAPIFNANTKNICAGQSVSFTDLSIGAPTTWNWSFAGGTPSTSSLQNPVVTYSATGIYNVSLTVSNINGPNTLTETAFINVITPQPVPYSEGFTSTFTPINWENIDKGNDGVVWLQNNSLGSFGLSTASAFFDNYNNDVNRKRDELRTPKFNFSAAIHPKLFFDRAYARYSGANTDTLAILISTDCGTTFTEIYNKGDVNLATAPDETAAIFTPNSTQWKTDTVDLLSYAGQPNVLFAFQNRGFYGQAIYIDNINIVSPLNTGIIDANKESTINIFPNPTNGKVSIAINSTNLDNYNLDIFNSIGQIIYTETIHQETKEFKKDLNLGLFGKGIYIIKLTNTMSSKSVKVIVD